MKTMSVDRETLNRRVEIAAALRRILPPESVIDDAIALAPYETDAFTAYRQPPMIVALPASTEEVAAVLAYCHEHNVKIVPRGAGTSLSGGSIGLADGVTLGLAKLNRILKIDLENRCVVAHPGVTNLGISNAVASDGFYYAPDPSSQLACTIGGNVAENSGGVHLDPDGYDLLGAMVGSEGLLGVVTEVTVRILPKPQHARAMLIGFASVEAAGECVAQVIAQGIIPAGMEMMDRASIHAAEAFVHAGYPLDVEALLIAELDGPMVEIDRGIARVQDIARATGATCCYVSTNEDERLSSGQDAKPRFRPSPASRRIT